MTNNEIGFILSILATFIIYVTVDLGRVKSERYGLFTKIGFLQFLLITLAVILIESATLMRK